MGIIKQGARAAVLAGALLAAQVATAGAASAHSPTNFSSWSGNHTICATCSVRQGDLVGAWQNILYTEGLLGKCVSTSANAIDGFFGAGTTNATRAYQQRYGLTADGIVGGGTWQHVRNRLVKNPATSAQYNYRRANGNLTIGFFYSSYTPVWRFTSESNPGNEFRSMDHPGITFYTC